MENKGEGKVGELAEYICAGILTPRSLVWKGTGTVYS